MTRRALANRRPAETFEFTVADLRYMCTVGRFPDGSIAELFLNNHKSQRCGHERTRLSNRVLDCGAMRRQSRSDPTSFVS